ncbi:MAG: hypothetical protein M3O15_12510, partial [Acidobacteriota bacterium]|nr:hypothetical protein [Acidobacteriota bacterium]
MAAMLARSARVLRFSAYRLLSPVLVLTAACGACRPTAYTCAGLMPVAADAVRPAGTPAGTTGCAGDSRGIPVAVEAVRKGLSWERGRIWIDGAEAAGADLS